MQVHFDNERSRRRFRFAFRFAFFLVVVLSALRPMLWKRRNPNMTISSENAGKTSTVLRNITSAAPLDSSEEVNIRTAPLGWPTNASNTQSAKNPPGPIKTLVILIGNLRCGELAWKSLYDNLLDYPHATRHIFDLALAIGDTDPFYQNATLFRRARYYWKFEEYGNDWSKALDAVNPEWKSTVAPLLHNKSLALGGVHYGRWKGSGAISFWIRWFLSQRLMEDKLVGKYDRFIITRTDHFYLCPHDLSNLTLEHMWIPNGQDYGGITDRHLIVPSTHVLTALNILPHLFAHPTDYGRLGDRYYNPEALLRDAWINQGLGERIKRFPRMMFTCVNPTKVDHSRWKKAGHMAEEGVRKKYTKEYALSGETCNGISSRYDY